MKYYSTSDTSHRVGLDKAVLHCIAPDGGVYMPDAIPLIPKALFNNIPDMSLNDIAYVVATTMFGSDITASQINDIVKETLSFQIPLVKVAPNRYALELFHGPTGSFKDIGARFMARIVGRLLENNGLKGERINVFVATSGDTGSAVANGFAKVPNTEVFILHPKEAHLRVAAESFIAPASNIHPIKIRGSFEQCQQLVKEIYTDPELNKAMNITSANTINIARLLPQIFFFFHAYAQLKRTGETKSKIAIAAPCGNLGNLTAALFSLQMGLPVNRIVAAGRDNDRLWGSISSGALKVNDFNSKALSTNVARINSLFAANPDLANIVECQTFTDSDIDRIIVDTFHSTGYLLGRNSAMAYAALDQSISPDEAGIFLATVSPEHHIENLTKLLGESLPFCPVKAAPHPDRSSQRAEPALPPLFGAVKRHLLDHI